MLLSKTTKVKWNSRNKNHYEAAGYEYTKMGDEFTVRIEDLTSGSYANVMIMCDYCGKEFSNNWQTYLRIKKKCAIDKDCCASCAQLKAKESIDLVYGGASAKYFSSNEKRAATNIDRYGSSNVFGSKEIKERIKLKNVEKYGVPYTQQSPEVRSKTIATCLEKYGVENYVELFRGKFIKENSPVWKGGPEYSRVERATHEYSEWRSLVFQRDSFTCARCGSKSGIGHTVELQAHHIANWKDNPDKRYEVENGITLCERCHNEFHSLYGKRNNNITQIKEFLTIDEKIC